MTSSPRLFHLAVPGPTAPDPTSAAPWTPPEFAGEGFIHLSTAAELGGTLALHFAGHSRVELWEVAPDPADPALRWVPSRGGRPFPHLHRALLAAELRRCWSVPCVAGAWSLPRLGVTPAGDDPPGQAPDRGLPWTGPSPSPTEAPPR